ncbi:MAG: hypothetical protein HQL95_00645 [Magnetococcales bacterium]|nr:hypothetical protein [Magnetococcales bacterium]
MKEIIPFRMVKSGDQERTTHHEFRGKRLLESLLDGMKAQGLQQGKKQQTMPDGTVIRVYAFPGENRIHITAPTQGGKETFTPRAQPSRQETMTHPPKGPANVTVTPKIDRHDFAPVGNAPVYHVSPKAVPAVRAKPVADQPVVPETPPGEQVAPEKAAARHDFARFVPVEKTPAVRLPRVEGGAKPLDPPASTPPAKDHSFPELKQETFVPGDPAIPADAIPHELPPLSQAEADITPMESAAEEKQTKAEPGEFKPFYEEIYEEKQYVLYGFKGSEFFVGRQLGKHWRKVSDIGFKPHDVIHTGRGTFIAIENQQGFRVSTDRGRTWEPMKDLTADAFDNERKLTGKWPGEHSQEEKINLEGYQFSARVAVVSPGRFVFFTADTGLKASTATWTGKQEPLPQGTPGEPRPEPKPVEVKKRESSTMGLPSAMLALRTKQYRPGMVRSPIINIGGGKLVSFFCGMSERNLTRTVQSSLRVENEGREDLKRNDDGIWESKDIGNLENPQPFGAPIGMLPDGTNCYIPHSRFGVHASLVGLIEYNYSSGFDRLHKYDHLVQYVSGTYWGNNIYRLLDPNYMMGMMTAWATSQTTKFILPDMPLYVAEKLVKQGPPIVTHAWEDWVETYTRTVLFGVSDLQLLHQWSTYVTDVRNGNVCGKFSGTIYDNIWYHGIINATLDFSWKPEEPGRPVNMVVNAEFLKADYTCYTMMSNDGGLTWVSIEKAPFAFALWSVALGENVVLVYGVRIDFYATTEAKVVFGLWRSDDGRKWELVLDDKDGNWFLKPTDWTDSAWNEWVVQIFPMISIEKTDLFLELADRFIPQNVIVSLGRIREHHKDKDKLLWMKPHETLVSEDLGKTFTSIDNPFNSVGKPIPLGDIPFNLSRPWEVNGAALVGVCGDCDAGKVDRGDPGGPGFFLSKDNGESWSRQSDTKGIFSVMHANRKIDLALPELYKGLV